MSETTTNEPEFLAEIKAHQGAWCFMYEGEDGQSWTQGSFAPDHAAAEITKLTSQLDEARAHIRNVLNYLEDEENAHDIPVGVAERTRLYLEGYSASSILEEARAKAIEECAAVAERLNNSAKSTPTDRLISRCIARDIRALLHGSTK